MKIIPFEMILSCERGIHA